MKIQVSTRFYALLFACIFVLSSFVFPQTSSINFEEFKNQIEGKRQEIIDTPLKIIYTLETTTFYPVSNIITWLPDNKVEIETPSVKTSDSAINEVTRKIIGEYSAEYNLPYTQNAITVMMIKNINTIRYESEIPQKKGHKSIWAFDGKKTRVLQEHLDLSDAEIVTEGKIYEGYKSPYLHYFDPALMGYSIPKGISDSCVINRLSDGRLSIINQMDNYKNELVTSNSENRIIVTHDMQKGAARKILKINRTIKVENLILPSDIEKRDFDGHGNPKIFFHIKDINYEILKPEDVKNYGSFEFPQGTIIKTTEPLTGVPE